MQSGNYHKAESIYLYIIDNYETDDTDINAFTNIAELYNKLGNQKSALHFAKLALQSAYIHNNTDFRFRANTLIASILISQNEIDESNTYLSKNVELYGSITSNDNIARYHFVLGKYAIYHNDYVNGIRELRKADNIYKDDILNTDYAEALMLMSRIYLLKNDFRKAEQNAQEAQMIFEKINNTIGHVEALCLMSDIRMKMRDTKSVWDNISSAKRISDTTDLNKPKVTVNLHLAQWYMMQGNMAKAQSHIKMASNLCQNISDYEILFYQQMMLCQFYIINNNIEAALRHMDSAKEISAKNQMWYNKYLISQTFGDICYKQRNYMQAAENYRRARILSDSTAVNVMLIDADTIGAKQEADRKEFLINFLTSTAKIQETTIENNERTINDQKSFIYSFGGLFIIAAILMFLFAWSFMQKFRDNKELEHSYKEIAQQKEEIEAQKIHLLEYTHEIEKLSAIAKETDNAIRVFDTNGETTWVNPGYTRMYGYTLNDLQKDNTLCLAPNSNIKQLIANWDSNKQSVKFEYEVQDKFKKQLWVQSTITPICDIGNTYDIKQLVAIDTNITSIKQAQQSIMTMNDEITASITYAKRIQEAMLSPFSILTKYYPNSFCFYKPRAIVSGDFYWITEQSGRLIVSCADSTGHGVPGAFLSLIGISFLSKIVNERNTVQPAIILNRLRMNIISHLHQSNTDMAAGDGMDMSLISIDKENHIMEFAGAMNPIYIIRDNNIIELKPDRMPVGFYDNEDRAFSCSKVKLEPGDQLYLFSDGYYDQFGGESGLKMKTSRFKQILRACNKKSNDEQIAILENEFNSWRGHYEQVDDMLIIGIQIV